MTQKVSHKKGRPAGSGPTQMLKALKVGESLYVPTAITDTALLQAARNRFYIPAQRLGIKLSFEIEGDNVKIRREK